MLARIKSLFGNLAIYGLGDVATSIISLLLLPVYTRYLTPSDYGVIAMLLTVEASGKIVFRWGVDTAFMRLYYDCPDQKARQRLASTLFIFLVVLNGSLLLVSVPLIGRLSQLLFGSPEYRLLLSLVLINTFVVGFYFIPFQVLRILEQPKPFIALVFGRSASTLILRLLLVIGAGMGVMGVVLADIIVTAVFTLVLSRWFVPLIRPMFSAAVLRDALGFGLPRIPHSLAHQVMGMADRFFLNAYATLRDVGLYSIGASFGLALKLFLSAFETAWTPFFLGVMKEPDAKRIYSTVSTYVVAVLVLLTAGLCATAADVIHLTTTEEFFSAARVTPWIALGVLCQGIYLVGSIGLMITKQTTRYPIATGLAAGASLVANAWLIPRHGMMGAAWANTVAYATLAAATVGFSMHAYPIRYEWLRLLRIGGAGVMAYAAAQWMIGRSLNPLTGLLLRGSVTVVVYGLVLLATGFFIPQELRLLRDTAKRVSRGRKMPPPQPEVDQVEMAGEIVATGTGMDVRDSGLGTRTDD